MNGEKISRCLDAMPDTLLEEAMVPYRPRSLGRHIVRIAACLALVVAVFAVLPRVWEEKPQLGLPTFGVSGEQTLPTDQVLETMPQKFFAAPGILKVYGSSKVDATEEELKQYEMTDAVGSYGEVMTIGGGFAPGISLLLRFPEGYYGEAEITLDVFADYGFFFGNDLTDTLPESVKAENGSLLWWHYGSLEVFEENENANGIFFVNIVIYADETIVGYGVVDFSYGVAEYGLPIFWTTGFTTVCYPLIGGEYQAVTEEYIWQEIEKYKEIKSDMGKVEILMNK